MDNPELPHYSEEDLERYIRDPRSLAVEDLQRIEEVLARSESARSIKQSIERFYEMLHDTPQCGIESVDRFVDEIVLPTSVTRLHPLKKHFNLNRDQELARPVVWATATEAPPVPTSTFSFASRKGDLVVRIICGDTGQPKCLFVVSENAHGSAFGLVSFPDLQVHLPVDAKGWSEARPLAELRATELELLKPLFRVPTGGCTISESEWDALLKSGSALLRKSDELEVAIDVESEGEPTSLQVKISRKRGTLPQFVVVSSAERYEVILLENGCGKFERRWPSGEITLRTYA